VVGVEVGHDRHVRPVQQERPVALVRLDDEVLAAAVVCVRADLGDLAADHERRVEAGVLQDHREQRGCCGLSVGTGDRDRPAVDHGGGERLGPVQDPQAARARLDEFQVVGRDRGGVHDRVDAVEVGRLVGTEDGAAERGQ
jgi:hypothetical protein